MGLKTRIEIQVSARGTMDPMLDRVVTVVREVAQELVLPRFRNLAAGDVAEKGPGDLVTVADREAETALETRLAALLPGSLVVGEEAAAADHRVLARVGDPGPVWVIDPIDGTGNFAAGAEPFAVMVALLRGGAPVLSVIHQPVSGLVAAAELGAGCYLDSVPMWMSQRAAAAPELRGAMYLKYLPADVRAGLLERAPQLGEPIPVRHCAGWEYPELVRESRDFLLFWKGLPWDHAPGALLVREAGGVVRYFDGAEYDPAQPRQGLLACRNDEVFQVVQKALFA